ncbi:MAG TPA: hypothetical protein VE195_02500 [Acidobacteriaceae bacterium]|nr:hypothetical protein [Acidobacteriaceae bacterium]
MIARRKLLLPVLTFILAGFVLIGSGFASSSKTNPGTAAKATNTKAAATNTSVSASEIASAKSKGLVWVNTESKVYHKDGRYYGHTKQGKFMTEADAQKAGYKAAKK